MWNPVNPEHRGMLYDKDELLNELYLRVTIYRNITLRDRLLGEHLTSLPLPTYPHDIDYQAVELSGNNLSSYASERRG